LKGIISAKKPELLYLFFSGETSHADEVGTKEKNENLAWVVTGLLTRKHLGQKTQFYPREKKLFSGGIFILTL
jgi:hypothetical protein